MLEASEYPLAMTLGTGIECDPSSTTSCKLEADKIDTQDERQVELPR